MPGQKDDRIRKGELFDEQRKKEEEDRGVDFEAIFARIARKLLGLPVFGTRLRDFRPFF